MKELHFRGLLDIGGRLEAMWDLLLSFCQAFSYDESKQVGRKKREDIWRAPGSDPIFGYAESVIVRR